MSSELQYFSFPISKWRFHSTTSANPISHHKTLPCYLGFCPAVASAQNVRLATEAKSYERKDLGTIVITLWPWPATWQQSHCSGWEHFSLRQPSRYICYFTSRVFLFWETKAFQDFCYQKLNIMEDRTRGTKKPAYEKYMLFSEVTAIELVKKMEVVTSYFSIHVAKGYRQGHV